jgi:hypothetical protein
MKWFDCSVENWMVRDDVCGEDWEREILEKGSEFVVSTVEFVVSEGHAVETDLVEGFGDFLTAVVAVEECAL